MVASRLYIEPVLPSCCGEDEGVDDARCTPETQHRMLIIDQGASERFDFPM